MKKKKKKREEKKHFLTFATSSERSYISWLPCAVITTPTGAALSCTCNETLPPETRGRVDSAPHFAVDFCRFRSHPEVDLLRPQKGSKTITLRVCAEFASESKPKIEGWLYDDLRLFFFSFSKFSPIYQDHHHSVSFQHHNGRHTTGKKNRKSICRLLLSTLSGFEMATNGVWAHYGAKLWSRCRSREWVYTDAVCTQGLDDAAANYNQPPFLTPQTWPIIFLLWF